MFGISLWKIGVVLAILGGVVGYFKYTGGKRFFKMAPLHHHFEQLGWPEPKVIVRFWIVAAILAIASLSTLKLR